MVKRVAERSFTVIRRWRVLDYVAEFGLTVALLFLVTIALGLLLVGQALTGYPMTCLAPLMVMGAFLFLRRGNESIQSLLARPWRVDRGTLFVGDDGLRVPRLGGERFVPFDRVEGVRANLLTHEVRIRLTQGEELCVRTLKARKAAGRIRERLKAFLATEPPPGHSALARTATREAGYRELSLTEDQLVAVVECQRSDPELRAEAAAALAGASRAVRVRVRAVADEVAHPELRRSLEATVEEAPESSPTSARSLRRTERGG